MDVFELLWPILLERMDARTLTRVTATCRALRTTCLPPLLEARERDADRFFARLVSDLGRLCPLELDPSCDHRYDVVGWKARFYDIIPHHDSFLGEPQRPGTRTVGLRRTGDGLVEIVIRDSQNGMNGLRCWLARSNLTEVALVRVPGCRVYYQGEFLDTFDKLWRLVLSGEIATKPVDLTRSGVVVNILCSE